MKKNIALIVLVAAVVVLFIQLLTDGKPVDSHKAMYEKLQAEHGNVLKDRDSGRHINDSLIKELIQLKANEVRLKKQLTVYRSDLDKTLKDAVKYANKIKAIDSDSSDRDIACNDLVEQVNAFATLYVHYRDLSDSLTLNADSTRLTYEAANEKLNVLYNNLYVSYDRLYSAYVSLIADQQSLQKSIRRQKLKTKVAIVLGLLGTGAALMK